MRIISKFHDYYDPIQRHGQDLTLIYNRIQTETGKKKGREYGYVGFQMDGHRTFAYAGGNKESDYEEIQCQWWQLGFCGKVYPLCQVLHLWSPRGEYTNRTENRYLMYSLEEVSDWVMSLENDYLRSKYLDSKNKWGVSRVLCSTMFTEIARQNWDDEFHKTKAPIILKQPWDYVCVNPKLADLEFYRVKDAYTAFQEIAGFIGGVLGVGNKPIPVPDDEIMRDIKGFDKMSFKKEPTTAKKRGKKR